MNYPIQMERTDCGSFRVDLTIGDQDFHAVGETHGEALVLLGVYVDRDLDGSLRDMETLNEGDDEMTRPKPITTIESDRKMRSIERAIKRFDSAAQDWAFRGLFDLGRRLDSEREYERSRDSLEQLIRVNIK